MCVVFGYGVKRVFCLAVVCGAAFVRDGSFYFCNSKLLATHTARKAAAYPPNLSVSFACFFVVWVGELKNRVSCVLRLSYDIGV